MGSYRLQWRSHRRGVLARAFLVLKTITSW